MAAEMINKVLQAESKARINEENAKSQAEAIIKAAEEKSADIYNTIVKQAESEASLLVTEAHDLTDEIVKQAASIAKLRERKVISDMEKKYPEMISLLFKSLDLDVN